MLCIPLLFFVTIGMVYIVAIHKRIRLHSRLWLIGCIYDTVTLTWKPLTVAAPSRDMTL